MKLSTYPALAGMAMLAVAFSPVLCAQTTSGPDSSQDSRAKDSTDANQSTTTGSSASQPGTLEKNNSKDAASETRDANPGSAPTGSAKASATKDPSVADTNGKEIKHHHSDKMSDKEFMMMAAQGGMTEVELGKVAGDKASSSDVKDFGAMMVTDHTKANDQLKGIAEKKGVTLSPDLDAKHRAMVDKMSKLSGAAFDKQYVQGMVRDHQKTISLFEDEAKSGQDPEVKSFASDTLPTLKEHLSRIEAIQKKVK